MRGNQVVTTPKSVLAFRNDLEVKAGVQLLLSRKRRQVPADTPWEDLRSYYRALSAAKSVQFDYADLLCQLWDATWGAISPLPKATSLPLSDCDPQKIWDTWEIDREFKLGLYTYEMMVYLDPTAGAQIGIDLRQGRRVLLKKGDFPDEWEEGQSGFWSPPNEVMIEKTVDTEKLKRFATEARGICLKRMKA
jgi:hypothetical protein